MKFTISSRERTAAIFLVGSMLLVAAFAVGAAVRNHWFSPRISYHTLLTRGDGLRTGSPILMSGVEVGHIGAMTIRDDQRVDVELVVLAEHAGRIREGIRAVPRRLFGLGDKRIQLEPKPGATEPLPPGAEIPSKEPMEILDLVETIDFGQYLRAADRIVAALDKNLALLDKDDRVERLFAILDRLQPLAEHLDAFVTDADKPLVALLKDPKLTEAVRGVATFTDDPALHSMMQNATTALDPHRMDKLLTHADEIFERIDRLAADDGHLAHLVLTGDKLLGDGRADRMIGALERLADEKKLGALVDHLGVLADEMSRVGPEIPALTKDLHSTLKEAVVVLKALQETWILNKESKKVRAEEAH